MQSADRGVAPDGSKQPFSPRAMPGGGHYGWRAGVHNTPAGYGVSGQTCSRVSCGVVTIANQHHLTTFPVRACRQRDRVCTSHRRLAEIENRRRRLIGSFGRMSNCCKEPAALPTALPTAPLLTIATQNRRSLSATGMYVGLGDVRRSTPLPDLLSTVFNKTTL